MFKRVLVHFHTMISDWDVLKQAAIILLGALAHAGMQYQKAKKNNVPFKILDGLIYIFVACFTGYIFGTIGGFLFTDQGVVGAMGGVGAWLGFEGMNRISRILLTAVENKAK